MKPLYIFDLDGTLALIHHRRHFVENPTKQCPTCRGTHVACPTCKDNGRDKWKPNWDAFHAACVDDVPNRPVISILEKLQHDADIWVWSGRSNLVFYQTYAWLDAHLGRTSWDAIRMRQAGDFTPDDILKRSWLRTLHNVDRERLVATFDDRDRIVKMWRDEGITCLQVAPGDF